MEIRLGPLDPASREQMDAAFEAAKAMEAANGTADLTRAMFDAFANNPESMLSAQRLAWAGDRVVGCLLMECDRTARDFFLDSFALPEFAEQVHPLQIAAAMASAREVAAAEPSTPAEDADPFEPDVLRWQAGTGTDRGDTTLESALGSAGFRHVRTFYRMLMDLAEVPAPAITAPAGATIAPVGSPADREVIADLMRRSFADHFGATSDYDTEEWLAAVSARPGGTPDRWWIARLDGHPVGYCMCDDTRAERNEGHVMNLGVLPEARGRGIGRWMLELAIQDARDRGHSAIGLSVDSGNVTPALGLYESAGMQTHSIHDFWMMPV